MNKRQHIDGYPIVGFADDNIIVLHTEATFFYYVIGDKEITWTNPGHSNNINADLSEKNAIRKFIKEYNASN
jgi:hypothetical protein